LNNIRINKNKKMKESIKKQNFKQEYFTQEKCYITELSNTPDDPEISIARARVEPGVSTRRHRLKGVSERFSLSAEKDWSK